MAEPQAYNREYSFAGFQSNSPHRPLPAPPLDNEFANIEAALSGVARALRDVRRSDGALQNGVVTLESLSTALLLQNSLGPVPVWETATAYAAGQVVLRGTNFYRAVSTHTSDDFTDDLAAGKWALVGGVAPPSASPLAFGAVGDGSAVDLTAWTAAEAEFDHIYLDAGKTFNIGTTYPAKPVYGPGTIKVSGTDMVGFQPAVSVRRQLIQFTPPTPPSPQNNSTHLTVAIGHGIGFRVGGITNGPTVWRSVVVGAQALEQPANIERCEIIGNGAALYAQYLGRTTLVGSIAGQWLGVTDPDASNHNFWRRPDGSGGYLKPGDVGWDTGSLPSGLGTMEGNNPGIGAKILAFAANNNPSHPDHCQQNVGIGRDALNNTLIANDVTAVGYASGSCAVGVSKCTFVGSYAHSFGAFVAEMVTIGDYAAVCWQEGRRSVTIGSGAARVANTGGYSVVIGSFAGAGLTSIGTHDTANTGCVIIGYGVTATSPDTTPTNWLAIGNASGTVRPFLISGDFAVGCVVINGRRDKITDGLFKVFNTSEQLRFEVNNAGMSLPVMSAPSSPASTNIWRTSGNLGSDITGGTVTLDPRDIAMNYYTNNGNHTLTVASVDGMSVCLIENGSTPGSVNTSVFNWIDPGSDTPDTVPGNKFLVVALRVNVWKMAWIKALQ